MATKLQCDRCEALFPVAKDKAAKKVQTWTLKGGYSGQKFEHELCQECVKKVVEFFTNDRAMIVPVPTPR